MLVTYLHIWWARGQLKNPCSTNFKNCEPQWGQLSSISIEVRSYQSFTVNALWMIDQRKAPSYVHCVCAKWCSTWESTWGNFNVPCDGDCLFENLLGSDPFPPKLGLVCRERSNLKPPPSRWFEEEFIKFSKEQGKLSMGTPSYQNVHPNLSPSTLRKS